MSIQDIRGILVSTNRRDSVDRLEQATELLHGFAADPLEVIDVALAEEPDFVMGHCLRAGVLAMAMDRTLEPAVRQSVASAEALWPRANERERGHILALRAWLDGDWQRSALLFGQVLIDFPLDSLALHNAHIADFYLGRSLLLRDRVARALPYWNRCMSGFGFVLGMHAFGLAETGDYGRAEETGQRAVALNPKDVWALHAVAHVYEMRGQTERGIAWLADRTEDWSEDNFLACHNWWHLALFYLDRGQHERVLSLYDTAIRNPDARDPLDMVDASALLWRLILRDVNVGGRWTELADKWEATIEDGLYAFNDCHAMMAFVGAGRTAAASKLLDAMTDRTTAGGCNAAMVRDVGLGVCRALLAFGYGDYAEAANLLLEAKPVAARLGGSHAQRDILGLTAIEAALRDNRPRLARALAAERTECKPDNPFNWCLTARALDLLGDPHGAARARANA